MSNIPNSAMPHAVGQTEISGNDTGSVQAAGTESDSYRGSQQAGSYAGSGGGSSMGSTGSSGTYQPETYRRDTYSADRSRENGGGLMEKAREHKTGIALGVAVGAIAAAAIPFMFGKKKSSERGNSAQYDGDLYVDNRTATRSASSAMSGTTTTGTSGTTGAAGSTTTTGTGGTSASSGSSF